MAAPERSAAILLAAGLSRRFGSADKLTSLWEGRPLIDHAAAMLAGLPFAIRIAVVRAGAPDLGAMLEVRGFTIVENAEPESGIGHSIALGIAAVGAAEAAVIALGDMPCVPTGHIRTLCARAGEDTPIVASLGLGRPSVPAAFIASQFDRLRGLTGDQGARDILIDAATIAIDRASLIDIDR